MQKFSEIFHKFRKYRINPNKIGKLEKKNEKKFKYVQKNPKEI